MPSDGLPEPYYADHSDRSEHPKRARMLGRIVGGVLIRRKGHSRRCFCDECLHDRASRSSEKRSWRNA